MIVEKKLAYDWMGTNGWLFTKINSLGGNPTYDSLMVFLSHLGDRENFHYLIGILLAVAFFEYLSRKALKRGGGETSLILWVGVFLVLVSSHITSQLTVYYSKNYFQYPRPYVAQVKEKPKLLVPRRDADDDYRSFPSGHASLITVVVASLWPILSGYGPIIGAALIFGVCWSRIAVGMHYPADVLAGFLIGFIIVLLVRWTIYTLLFRLFKLKC